MRRFFFPLLALLALVTGCVHAQLPVLPASHGHLSLALDTYQGKPSQPVTAPVLDAAEVVEDPAQAPAIFQEAVAVLKGAPTEQQVRDASKDLQAACDSGFEQACDFLREQFKGPEKIEGPIPTYPLEAIRSRVFAVVVLRCRLGVDGKPREGEVLEMAPYGFTEAVVEAVKGSRYRPARLAGHPIEIPYVVIAKMTPSGDPLTPEQERAWLRMRTERFPESTPAWFGLTRMLAEQGPKDPAYLPALRHLSELNPRYWWSANELAWEYVQAGRYKEAAPLVKRARYAAPLNSYVLETSAATLFGLGQCEAAVAEQGLAVKRLPEPWPAPERERFQRVLDDYVQRCHPSSGSLTPSG